MKCTNQAFIRLRVSFFKKLFEQNSQLQSLNLKYIIIMSDRIIIKESAKYCFKILES